MKFENIQDCRELQSAVRGACEHASLCFEGGVAYVLMDPTEAQIRAGGGFTAEEEARLSEAVATFTAT